MGSRSLPGIVKLLASWPDTFINRVLDPLQVDDEIVIMGEVQVSFVSLVADCIRQVLKEMTHASTVRKITEMWLPLLYPIGEISHGLRWALVAFHVSRLGHLQIDSILKLVNKKCAKSTKCNFLTGNVVYLSIPLILKIKGNVR
mgnify:CR=1 FL=1